MSFNPSHSPSSLAKTNVPVVKILGEDAKMCAPVFKVPYGIPDYRFRIKNCDPAISNPVTPSRDKIKWIENETTVQKCTKSLILEQSQEVALMLLLGLSCPISAFQKYQTEKHMKLYCTGKPALEDLVSSFTKKLEDLRRKESAGGSKASDFQLYRTSRAEQLKF